MNMRALFLSEWERMWKRKKTKTSLILFAAVVLFDCWFLKAQGVGAFDAVSSVPLNVHNFSVFLLKEVSFLLTLIVAPLLIIDSMNSENAAGQLRLVLIRPISFAKLAAAKWLCLAAVLFLFTVITFGIGEAVGRLWLPDAATVTFLNPEHTYDAAGALGYALRSYGLFLLILLAELSVVGLISSSMPNAIVSYLVWVGVMVGALYGSEALSFFLLSASTIFKLLAGTYGFPFFPPVLVCLGLGFLATIWTWQNRNWPN